VAGFAMKLTWVLGGDYHYFKALQIFGCLKNLGLSRSILAYFSAISLKRGVSKNP
jgi:hypothetical protein